jgi:ribosome maturation factor RimP
MSRGNPSKPQQQEHGVQAAALRQKLLALAEPVCEYAGYELVDLRFASGRDGWVLEVFIDHPEREGAVGLDDCERVSRELGAVFDVEDPIAQAYRLEVSSPGIDRRLRKPHHFRRHLGEQAKIALIEGAAEYGGRRNYTGRLTAVTGEGADARVALEADGQSYQLPIDGIATARLVPDWDALLGRRDRGAQAGRQ